MVAVAAKVLDRLHQSGIRLTAEGDRLIAESTSALTDDTRTLIREHKPELLKFLEREDRRRRVLDILADASPEARYAYLTDDKSHPDYVILVLAIRGVGTCELSIPRNRYDPFLLMQMMDKEQLPH